MSFNRQILKNCVLFLRQRLFKGVLVKYLSIIFVQLFFLSCSGTEMTKKNQIDDGIAKAKTLGEDHKIIDSKQGRVLATANTCNETNYRDYIFTLQDEECDLQGANLQGANLYRANLYRANLQGADLQRANLEGADLRNVINLSDSNHQYAKKNGAILD